jgi:hypothetical protein
VSDVPWVCIGFGGWIVLAAIVGLVVGRVIRNRDRQAPKPRRTPQAWPLKRKK